MSTIKYQGNAVTATLKGYVGVATLTPQGAAFIPVQGTSAPLSFDSTGFTAVTKGGVTTLYEVETAVTFQASEAVEMDGPTNDEVTVTGKTSGNSGKYKIKANVGA